MCLERMFIPDFAIAKLGLIVFLLAALTGCSTAKYTVDDSYYRAKKAYEKKNYSKAETSYQQFIDDNPDGPVNEIALYYLASSKQHLGNFEGARELYQKLIDTYQTGFWVDLARQELDDISKSP